MTQSNPTLSSGSRFLWIEEAVHYLGLDRLGLRHPHKSLQNLVKKGALPRRTISRRLVFKREDLDRVLERGDVPPRRGRPPKNRRA